MNDYIAGTVSFFSLNLLMTFEFLVLPTIYDSMLLDLQKNQIYRTKIQLNHYIYNKLDCYECLF